MDEDPDRYSFADTWPDLSGDPLLTALDNLDAELALFGDGLAELGRRRSSRPPPPPPLPPALAA